MNSNSCKKNDISLTQYDIRHCRVIYLLRKYDIISVPSYASGIYRPPKVDIISKIYHPFSEERISLKNDKFLAKLVVFLRRGSKVFAGGEHIHSLRLKSKLFDLRSGYVNLQHNSLRLCAMFKSAYPQTTKQTCHEDRSVLLAGVARFELTNEGVKVPCLTAWRYPFGTWLLYHKSFLLSSSKMRFVRGCKGQRDQARLSITVPSCLTMLSSG